MTTDFHFTLQLKIINRRRYIVGMENLGMVIFQRLLLFFLIQDSKRLPEKHLRVLFKYDSYKEEVIITRLCYL